MHRTTDPRMGSYVRTCTYHRCYWAFQALRWYATLDGTSNITGSVVSCSAEDVLPKKFLVYIGFYSSQWLVVPMPGRLNKKYCAYLNTSVGGNLSISEGLVYMISVL